MSTLIVAPHMDDEVLGCAGLIQQTSHVKVVFLTEREWDVRLTAKGPVSYCGGERFLEMKAVAAALGYEWVRLQHKTHELDRVPIGDLVGELEDHLDGVTRLVIPGPSHDADHVAARQACEALMRPHCFHGTVIEYMTWGVPDPYAPAAFLPLVDHEVNLKVGAMETYATQTMPDDTKDELYPYAPESVRAFAAAAGRMIHEKWAEPFLVRRAVMRDE